MFLATVVAQDKGAKETDWKQSGISYITQLQPLPAITHEYKKT